MQPEEMLVELLLPSLFAVDDDDIDEEFENDDDGWLIGL